MLAGAALLAVHALAPETTPVPAANPANEIPVAAPTATKRVTAGARFSPTAASPGKTVTLQVRVRVASGHYIYDLGESETRSVPTSLDVQLPEGLRPAGPWLGPKAKVKEDGSKSLSGDLLFQRQFEVRRDAGAATWKVPVKVGYQVCSEAVCWPPAVLDLASELKVILSD